jgi:hypothetical protein
MVEKSGAGHRGGSIFDTPFKTRHVRAPPKFEFREYHRLPRQSSTRPASVYKSNPPGRKTGNPDITHFGVGEGLTTIQAEPDFRTLGRLN